MYIHKTTCIHAHVYTIYKSTDGFIDLFLPKVSLLYHLFPLIYLYYLTVTIINKFTLKFI